MDMDVYQRISQAGLTIRRHLEPFYGHSTALVNNAPPLTIEPLRLELPSRIQVQLNCFALSLRNDLTRALDTLVSSYVDTFDRTWRRLAAEVTHPDLPLTRLIDRLRGEFRSHFEHTVVQQFSNLLSNANIHGKEGSVELEDNRPSFNQEYIPFLQKYFEFDSYPSTRDREIMAKKSGMTPRQIEVWFQNHRRMARKTGAPITPKRTTGATVPPSLSFEFADEQMPLFKASEESAASNIAQIELVEKIVQDEEKAQLAEEQSKHYSVMMPRYTPTPNSRDLLNPPAPSYAFPAPWSKPAHESQFRHQVNRPTFSTPVWPRKYMPPQKKPRLTGKAAAKANEAKKAAEREAYDQMMQRMAFLSLHDSEDLSKDKKGKCKEMWTPPAATCAYTYVLPRAPHPAFVTPGSSPSTAVSTPSRSISTTSSSTTPAQDPAPTPSRRRKTAGLPKRRPKNPPSSAQRSRRTTASPSPARSSLSRSPSPSSRTPSLESSSSTSSLHRQSSISSISSASSIDPPTPKSSPTTLPSISVAGVDDALVVTSNPYQSAGRSVSSLDDGILLGFPAGFTTLSGSGSLFGDQTKSANGWEGYYSFSNERGQQTQQGGR